MRTLIYSLLLISTFSGFAIAQTNIGIIKGRILDSNKGKPIAGAIVYLADKNKECISDNAGSFFIDSLNIDQYTIVVQSVGYCMKTVNVKIDSIFPVINIDINLDFARIPLTIPDSIKDYHQQISKLNHKNILELNIDSVYSQAEFIDVTIKNISLLPVFIIEDQLCFSTVRVIIKDESGKEVKHNIINMGCDVGGITLPELEDFKRLEPQQSIKLSNIRTWYQLDKSKSYVKYSIMAIYETREFEYLPGVQSCPGDLNYDSYKDEKFVLNQATRGRYESVNPVVYNITQDSK